MKTEKEIQEMLENIQSGLKPTVGLKGYSGFVRMTGEKGKGAFLILQWVLEK